MTIRRFRPYLMGSQTILLTDHSSLLSLVKGKQMKSMRQQRYAMDLSEYDLTIVHRAGALMHMPDALSRCGYTPQHGESMVAAVEKVPLEHCNMEACANSSSQCRTAQCSELG